MVEEWAHTNMVPPEAIEFAAEKGLMNLETEKLTADVVLTYKYNKPPACKKFTARVTKNRIAEAKKYLQEEEDVGFFIISKIMKKMDTIRI